MRHGDITIKNGRIKQSNFDSYQMLRINEAPAVDVYLVDCVRPAVSGTRNRGNRSRSD